METTLKMGYQETLVASGLVDNIFDVLQLDPLPHRFTEGEYICRRGDRADSLWVIVSGSIAVHDEIKTLYIRHRPEVVGEQNILVNESFRSYDLVANESQVEVLTIKKESLERHPEANILWRNIAQIISLKLKQATAQTAGLLEQVRDDAQILRAYTNEYALSRRLRSGGRYLTQPRMETAVIWFSDIVNFSRYVLTLSPLRTAELVQQFFNAQGEAIQRHGGYIDKFMGDGLMAFWICSSDRASGNRSTCEDALKAAQDAVTSISRIHIGPQPLEIRIGLHIGRALSGDFGSGLRHQFTLIGADVNRAARLEQIHDDELSDAEDNSGPIRISPEFYDQLSESTRERYSHCSSATAKNLGQILFYC